VTHRPLVLTAADCRYFRSLWQFLLSAERVNLAKICDWRAYDLGLHEHQRKLLKDRFSWCELLDFDFNSYPEHVRVATGSYAWKPIIIAENLASASGPVFWFDSATILKTALEKPLRTVSENGIWVLKGQSPIHQHCDPRALDALSVPLEVRHVKERAAGAIGIDPSHPAVFKLVQRWKHCALEQQLILPTDATSYHKRDQALLSCLLLTAAARTEIKLGEDEVDISSSQPTRDMSTRNKVHREVPPWADPAVRAWFHIDKTVDQWSLRWQRFAQKRIGGLRRWWREHFTVLVCDLETGISRALPSPSYGYYADPFLWKHGEITWLFAEEYQYAKDEGRLVAIELADNLEVLSVRPITCDQFFGRIDCHSSFPFLFEINGVPHMIPETCERKSVDLYVCEMWPDRWQLKRRLLFGVDAADTMVLWSEGYWWLFTSVRAGNRNRHLEIYYTDNLEAGTLRPHPQNKMFLYGDLSHGTGRNAGYLARSSGEIIRLIQKSQNYYGQGVSIMKVTELDTERFKETPIAGVLELPFVKPGFSTHHVSRIGNLIAYDVRDRVR
jgi:hypothetical protein